MNKKKQGGDVWSSVLQKQKQQYPIHTLHDVAYNEMIWGAALESKHTVSLISPVVTRLRPGAGFSMAGHNSEGKQGQLDTY